MSHSSSTQPTNPTSPSSRDPPPTLFHRPSPAVTETAPPSTTFRQNASPPAPAVRLKRNLSVLASRAFQSASAPRLRTAESSRGVDRADALWAEMQATLESVELSASGGTRVFGPDHDQKLADLRNAQIALAQAWARNEADDGTDTVTGVGGPDEPGDLKAALGTAGLAAGAVAAGGTRAAADVVESAKSVLGSGGAGPPSSGRGGGGGGGDRSGITFEEETEADILLARKRREANDRYFERVDEGVRDVVAKLQDVAVAMRAVEQESRNVWKEESVETRQQT